VISSKAISGHPLGRNRGEETNQRCTHQATPRQRELIEVLRRASLFSSLDEATLLALVERGLPRSFEANQTVFLQDDQAQGLHVVVQGRVKVYKTSSRGRAQTLMIMGPGEPVGEVAALSGGAFPATAETLEPTRTFYLPRQAFADLIAAEPEVALRLLAALSARLRAFASLIEDLALKGVSERLAAYLLSLAAQQAGRETLHLDLSKGELAAAMGTVPETLSRAFQQLARAGAVETRGRTVVIKDRKLLERVARAGQ
jgi:CRP/FNR family transcriptional regulator, dissimilatory nitrate respiration regulator